MFGWLTRRRIREQVKLVVQNQSALDLLSGWAEGSGSVELSRHVDALRLKNADCARKLPGNKPADTIPLRELLEINSEVRRLFDSTAMRHVHSFDKATEPSMGWPAYLDMRQEIDADD